MRPTFSLNDSNSGVSAVVGVLILVVLVLLLTAGVYFTATNLTDNQQQDITAGTTTERVSPYEYQATLVTTGNADSVTIVSPLGTEYNLSEVGDSSRILAIEYNSSDSSIGRLQIKGYKNSQQQLLKSEKVSNGINPELIVDKDGTADYTSIQNAIDNASSGTAENPTVIAVARGTYTENIDVSQNITLIAEHGTVIQDANPNEPVVHITGDDSQLRNFDVNGDPQPSDGDYASHGVLVDGENAQLVGNTLENAQSPDVTSSGIAINGKNTFVQYNDFKSNERSLLVKSNAKSPLVCGNQLSNSIGGFVSQQTKRDLAMNNYWSEGIPTSLVPDKVSDKVTASDLTDKESLLAASSRVPVSMLPESSRAGQPFPGTQLSQQSSGVSIEGCDVNVNFINTGSSFTLSDIRVLVGGQPIAFYQSSQQEQRSSSGQELANENDETVAVCECGNDGSYDSNDIITIYEPSNKMSSNPDSGGRSSQQMSEANFGANPATDTNYTVVEKSGTGDSTTYTPVDKVEQVASLSPPPQQAQSNSEDSTNETDSDLELDIGSKITASVGDQLTLVPVINGSDDNVTYTWNFDDGNTASGKSVEHIYTSTGTYTASLTATNETGGELANDSVMIEILESDDNQDFETVSSTSELQSIATDSSSSTSETIYLSNGTYSITTITNPNLNIVGVEDGVVFDSRVSVESSGVTLRNVELNNGVTVSAGDFKLYGSTVDSTEEYSVEITTSSSNIYIGSNNMTGNNGVFVDANSGVLVKDNTIGVSGNKAVAFGSRMSDVEVANNELTANEYGVYIGHATSVKMESNTISAPTEVYKVPNKDPVVNSISVDETLANVQSEFSVSVSDPQGDTIENVEWSVNDEREVLDPSEAFTHTFTQTGDYTVTVVVTDEFGAKTTATKTVSVTSPSVNLSISSPVSVGDSVKATVETNIIDSKIRSVKYSWGTGDTTTSRIYNYSSTGSYSITSTLTTINGEKFNRTESIDVVDSPVARFDVKGLLQYGNQLTLDASNSSAPNNVNLTYGWDVEGSSATGKTVTTTFNEFGVQTIELTVTDPDGYTDTTTKTIDINDVAMDFTVSNPGTNVDSTLDISTSAGNEIEEYHIDWDGDGSFEETVYTSTISHSFTTAGQRDLTVKAIDSETNSQTTYSESVTIYESPTFTLSSEKTNGYVTREYTFEATNVDGSGLSYQWNFGNGDTKTGQSVSYTYSDSGKYTVSLTVTDDNGVTKTKSVQVTMEYLDPYRGCKEFSSDTTLSAGTYQYDCVVVTAGTTITAEGDPSVDGPNSYGGVKFDTTGPIVVNGTINADYQGYGEGNYWGPGWARWAAAYTGYGCREGYGCYSGEPYGSKYDATRLGSDSADYNNNRASGGGSVWLISGEKVVINGEVTADGDVYRDAAGSGGSIRVESPVVKGDGILTAKGGVQRENNYAGSGGRIYVEATNWEDSWSITTQGPYWASDGTVVRNTVSNP